MFAEETVIILPCVWKGVEGEENLFCLPVILSGTNYGFPYPNLLYGKYLVKTIHGREKEVDGIGRFGSLLKTVLSLT
jgi:hypothetical protein